MSKPTEAEHIQTIYEQQLNQVMALQITASNNPSAENLQKVNIALEGWLILTEVFSAYSNSQTEQQ